MVLKQPPRSPYVAAHDRALLFDDKALCATIRHLVAIRSVCVWQQSEKRFTTKPCEHSVRGQMRLRASRKQRDDAIILLVAKVIVN